LKSGKSNDEPTPSKIPKTGRLGRWAKMIEEETNRDVVEKVMHNVNTITATSQYAAKAAWIQHAVERLETLVGEKTAIKIMENCGRKCCGPTSRARAQEIMSRSKSIEEFIEQLNKKGLGGGRLTLKDETTIRGGYDVCYCGQVKKTREPFSTKVYCYCSVGWYKQLFESALKKPVDVELVQSIISGADSCEFVIHV
jgi:predicted hydrocarbon binding protein